MVVYIYIYIWMDMRDIISGELRPTWGGTPLSVHASHLFFHASSFEALYTSLELVRMLSQGITPVFLPGTCFEFR